MGLCGWQSSPGLFTDLYELTMANAFYLAGMTEREACFYLSFRENPFAGGFTIACGLEPAAEYLESLRFAPEDLAFLEAQEGNDNEPLFDSGFLGYLEKFEFDCDVDAVPEGTVVFPGEPLARVSGPIISAQIVETALLNIVNYQSLVATKAARVCVAAGGAPVIEFGLRRAQGPDGGISGSRAAYVGGCSATSNTLAAREFGIPVGGTHAHSWVMAFDTEQDAFDAYARAMPNNCTFLVDTYDTLRGVERAVETGRKLRQRGHEMIGIRIDSGDLAWLSVRARKILDEGGFPDAVIVASNELDEYLIESLNEQGATIDVWGVGTKMVAAYDQPALGGVYKLSAVRDVGGSWVPRIKVSEQLAKVTTPGIPGIRRYSRENVWAGDLIYDESAQPAGEVLMVDPADSTRRKHFSAEDAYEELLVPVFRDGQRVRQAETLAASRQRAVEGVARLDPTITRFLNPHVYPVGLEHGLHELRTRLVFEAKGIIET